MWNQNGGLSTFYEDPAIAAAGERRQSRFPYKIFVSNLMKIHHMFPLLGRKRSFGENVRELLLCTDKLHLYRPVYFNTFNQPVKINAMGPGNVAQAGASAFYTHFQNGFVVLEDVDVR